MRRPLLRVAFLAVLLLPFAGCSVPSSGPSAGGETPAAPGSALPSAASIPAVDLAWTDPVRLASSAPALYLNSLAETSIAILPDGTVVVTASGCDNGMPHAGAEDIDQCRHSPTFRSRDGGATWQRLNQGPESMLAEAPQAIADSVVRADDAGALYYMSMVTDGGFLLLRSLDAGDRWQVMESPSVDQRDRPWLAAAGDGQLALAWWEGSDLVLATSRDGGASWTPKRTVAGGNVAMGSPLLRDDGSVLVPFATRDAGSALQVVHGQVGSTAWTLVDTGLVLPPSAPLGDPGRVQSVLGLAEAADGRMLLVWDQEGHGTVVTVVRGHSVVMGSMSLDGGRTWSEPGRIGTYNSIMPWVGALPDGSFVVGYYASDVPGDHYYVGSWRYDAVQVRWTKGAVSAGEPDVVDPLVRAAGGICTGGGLDCLPRGADRSFLDINELAVGPDGQVFAAYAAEDLGNAKASTIRVAAAR